jgi:DNA-binding NarL/FixJ family response regulator
MALVYEELRRLGLSQHEIGALLCVNEKTVRRQWEVAKVRLFQNIKRAK